MWALGADASTAATPASAASVTARAAGTTASGTDTDVSPASAAEVSDSQALGWASANAFPALGFLSGVAAAADHSAYASIFRSAAAVWVSFFKRLIRLLTFAARTLNI